MAERVTMMKLKVDLQCPSCYKKVKKILCKFPQIRDQVYDKKQNLVTITVVCCNPEKFRDKLCCKGCKVIERIEIVESPKPTPPPSPKPTPPPSPKPPSPKPTSPKPPSPKPTLPPSPKPPTSDPYPPVPIGDCCVPCSEGYVGGPCYHGHWHPVPPPPCYDYCECWCGYRKGYCRCDYFSEDNTGGCTIM